MEPITEKPEGMHWKTFLKTINQERLISQQYAKAVISELRLDENVTLPFISKNKI